MARYEEKTWSGASWEQRRVLLETLGKIRGEEPNASQLRIIKDDHTLRMVFGGERAGKSWTAGMDATTRIPFGRLFWIVGPDYDLPRREFQYIVTNLWDLDAIASKANIRMPREGRWMVTTKTGQVIMTRTSSDVRKLAADPVDGIIITEAGQCSYDTLLKCFGRVSETRGWVLVEGTFEEAGNWYASSADDVLDHPGDNIFGGVGFRLPTWSNTAIFPGGRTDPEILYLEQVYSKIPGLFQQRCGATPTPPLGVIFRDFSFVHHVSADIQYDPARPVYLAIDPGHGGPSAYAVCAVQVLEDPQVALARTYGEYKEDPLDYINVIDVIYLPGVQTEDAVEVAKSKRWWRNVIGGVIDVEAPDERKRWAAMAGVSLSARRVPVIEGERRMHTFLAFDRDSDFRPHIMFSAKVPEIVLREFSTYRVPVNSLVDMDGKAASVAKQRRGPEHALKALWYFMVIRYGSVKRARPAKPTMLPIVRRLLRGKHYKRG